MATDPNKVRVGLTGAVSRGPVGTAAPTDATTAINAAYIDSGAISEDGVTITPVGGGDRTPIKQWQGSETVRELRTSSDDIPTLSFTMLETKKSNVELFFDVTVTQTATHGTFDYTVKIPTAHAYVLDVVDGVNIHRYHVPRGVRAEVGDLVYQHGEAVGYEVTIEMERDPVAGYNFRGIMTDLKSVA